MYTLDAKSIFLVYGGALITGFADGSFIRIEFKNDRYSLVVGADGLGARARSNDESARITITLMPNSPANAILHAASMLDQATNAGALPLNLSDPPTGDQFTAEGAWVVKDPGRDLAKDPNPIEWVLETDKLMATRVRT